MKKKNQPTYPWLQNNGSNTALKLKDTSPIAEDKVFIPKNVL